MEDGEEFSEESDASTLIGEEMVNGSFLCPAVFDGYYNWEARSPGSYSVSCIHIPELVLEKDDNFSSIYFTKDCYYNGTWSTSNYYPCLDYIVKQIDPSNLRTAWILLCIYVFGGITSLICSAVSTFLFIFLRGILSSRNMLHAHLIASYTLKHLIVLIRIQPYVQHVANVPDPQQFVRDFLRDLEDQVPQLEEENLQFQVIANATAVFSEADETQESVNGSEEVLCKLLTAIMHYMFMCNIFWMFLEGWFLHHRVVTCTFDRHTPIRRYCCVGWGLPIPIVSIWVVAKAYNNPRGTCYYYETVTYLSWIMEGPIAAALLANLLFLLNIIRILVTKLRAIYSVEVNRIRKAARSIAVLLPLLGVSQLLLTYNPSSKGNENGYRIANALFQSTQGISVAIIYCFANPEVHAAMRNRWLRFQARRTCYKISQHKRSQQRKQSSNRHRNQQSSSIFEDNKLVAPKYSFTSRLRYLFAVQQASGSNSAASCDMQHNDNIIACPCYYHRNVIGPHSV